MAVRPQSLHAQARALGCGLTMASVGNYVLGHACLSRVLLIAVLAWCPASVWSRIPIPQWAIDLNELTKAPTIFRGRVADIYLAPQGANRGLAVAEFQVDRWY